MNNRDITLDFAKGLLIILVVLGHSLQYSLGYDWQVSGQFYDDIVFMSIYTFHMPLFMLISGYLFYNSNKKNYKLLLSSKLKAIGIPMLTFSLLFNMIMYVSMVMHGNVLAVIKHFFITILLGKAMWFLLSLLLNMAVIAILTRIIGNKMLQYVGMLILFVASLFVPDFIIPGVYKFMFPFFCIGYAIKQNAVPLYSCSNNKLLLFVLTILSAFAVWWFNKDTYIYTSGFCILNDYLHQFFINCKRMIIALTVSYTFMQYIHLFALYRNVVTDKLIHLGQMSLFIYGMNMVFNRYFSQLLSFLSINIKFNYLIPALTTVLFIPVCYCLYKFLENFKFTRVAFLGK